jgi:hypothetical protein
MNDFHLDSEFGYWRTRRHIPFLDRRVEVIIVPENEGADPTQRQLQVLESAESLPPSFMESLDDHATRHRRYSLHLLADFVRGYRRLFRMCGIRLEGDSDEWAGNEYEVTGIVVPPLAAMFDAYFFVEAECDWDEEHGLEFMVRNNVVVRCHLQERAYLVGGDWLQYYP